MKEALPDEKTIDNTHPGEKMKEMGNPFANVAEAQIGLKRKTALPRTAINQSNKLMLGFCQTNHHTVMNNQSEMIAGLDESCRHHHRTPGFRG